MRTTFLFADVIEKAKKMSYDFVFFDMGPSLGAINRSILLAMDFFVVPMSIDIFSMWAIKNIGTTVEIWQKELRTGISLAEDPEEVPSLEARKNLRFLGYVTQQHKERGGYDKGTVDVGDVQQKRIVQAYKDISDTFPEKIAEGLGKFFDAKRLNPHLGDIRHLGSLAPKSQSQHEPMISVRATGSYTSLRKQARDIYRAIAARYLENLTNS
jgi:cellulose biosynthesis protein BcsQ